MELSSVAAAKVSEDRELLTQLRQATPQTLINNVGLFFDHGQGPEDTLADRVRASSKRAKAKLDDISGLKIDKYLELFGCAFVSGTAEAIAKALELDSVTGATKGDRPIFRGASRR
jgi:post-segregation antitoxin (ccd killing protein)